VRADEEFVGWRSVQACERCGYEFIFASSGCRLPLEERGWYRWGDAEYNECRYQPKEWKAAYRFVVMRKREVAPPDLQLPLLDNPRYRYRVFVTNRIGGQPHEVIAEYDQRAAVENLIGEAQDEGILAIPSKRFQSHHVFFQVVMLAYNLGRWMQLLGESQEKPLESPPSAQPPGKGLQTLRITRLKTLYIAAKIVFHNNRDHLYYSIHDARTAAIRQFLRFLDRARNKHPAGTLQTMKPGWV